MTTRAPAVLKTKAAIGENETAKKVDARNSLTIIEDGKKISKTLRNKVLWTRLFCGSTFKLKISLSYLWKMKYDCEKHFCLIPQVGIIVDPSPAQPPSKHTSRAHSAQGVSTWHKHTHTGTDTHTQIHTHTGTHIQTNKHTYTHPHAQSQLHSPTQNSGCTTTRAGYLDMARSPSSNTSNYYDTSDQSMPNYFDPQTIYT